MKQSIKTKLTLLAAALMVGAQAHASLYDITYTGTDTTGSTVLTVTATGWLDINMAGAATAGQLTISGAGVPNAGTYNLIAGINLSAAPFSYDNAVIPGSIQFVDSFGGLLWGSGGTQFNMWYNTEAEQAALTQSGFTTVADSFGLWGNANGSFAPQSFGEATLTPVPETTTVVAGALMLLPFGLCTVRSLRKNRTI